MATAVSVTRSRASHVRTRLAVIATHPIQYYAPLFRLLAERQHLDLHVFYGWEGALRGTLDRGFRQVIQWDIPLLDGYPSTFVPNESRDPGTHHFYGLKSKALVPMIEQWRPNAILIFGWNFHSHLAALRAFHGHVPIFFRGDSTSIDELPSPRRWLRRRWLSWVYRHVDMALYVGINNKAYFLEHGLRESQLAWAPHSVENERFADTDGRYRREAMEWRRQLNIADGERTVLFAGKLEPKKAPDLLLEAFLQRGATMSNEKEHLIFVGSGPLEESLRARASGHSHVHFLGFANQSRMPAVYRLGDVFALPSRGPGETWGLAINEAMACERPVIATDRVGCAPDLVQPTQSGLVVPAGNVSSLATALSRLLDDAHLRAQMSKAASATIKQWSLTEQATRIEDTIEGRLVSAA
jgi:glycosyltransferase involved in cell wall biosynthesis